jgi:hypothetical protein
MPEIDLKVIGLSVMAAVALVAGAPTFAVGLGLLACVCAGLSPWRLLEKLRRRAAKEAFSNLDVVAFDRRWQGQNSEVARVRDVTDIRSYEPWSVEVLARTNANAWFAVEMRVAGTDRVTVTGIHLINETRAKELLGATPDVYERFFGKTEIA